MSPKERIVMSASSWGRAAVGAELAPGTGRSYCVVCLCGVHEGFKRAVESGQRPDPGRAALAAPVTGIQRGGRLDLGGWGS